MRKNDNGESILNEMEDKYYDLVWYARSADRQDKGYWGTVPEDIKEGAFKNQMRVERTYPEEVRELLSYRADWVHGFNSGILATVRLILALRGNSKRRKSTALDNFPSLDT